MPISQQNKQEFRKFLTDITKLRNDKMKVDLWFVYLKSNPCMSEEVQLLPHPRFLASCLQSSID